jgi:hypothetical protein
MLTRSAIHASILVSLALGALAAPLAAQDGRPPRGGPPPEALAACASRSAGAACSFTGRGGERITGTCFTPASTLPLACRPAGGPGPHGRGPQGAPPPEALSACSGIEVGDACAVDTPHGDTLEGTCRATPHGTACVPAHVGPPSDAP